MNSKILVILLLLCGVNAVAQKRIKKLDSINEKTTDMIYHDYSTALDNSDENKKKSTFSAYPYVFYTPESQLAGGAGGIYVFYTGQESMLRPSKMGFGGYYSTNDQYKISMNNSFYFKNNKLVIDLPISYGYFVNKYWGIGDETEEYDNASYTTTSFTTTLRIQVPPLLFSADRTGLIIDYDYTKIVDRLENELIDRDLPGFKGGQLLGFGSNLVWDSRDNIFYPPKGGYQNFSAIIYTGLGDYSFAKFELDARHFFSLPKERIIALNFFVQSVVGDTPFYKLPSLGGKQMRGYFFGRYRDNFYAMAQVEYRQYFSKRWGFVVFGTLGNVSHNIIEYDFKTIKYSYGSGIRFLFNKKERINLRADIGVGIDGNTGIYFGIEEAF